MSNLREAAQQALVAMKSANHVNYSWACVEAVAVLEAALAEDALQRLTDVQQEMEAQQEPICPDCKAALLYECVACSRNNYPPQRKPLTEEFQIAEALRRYGLTLVKTAKGYEVMNLGQIISHGIGEKHE
jgi:hypothetical protein